ncbi:MAG TPA: ATP-binding cassette domain-containing protein [Thermoanaerobaculia bacterium]|jgi:ABC-type multidrug transport system ATPase subunit|nr:ATP-binding cassette domain-containing protein [Thermoanaerobaculia bacterium]
MIELEGLAKTYADGTQALRGVDLRLDRGMVGLLGPNGAGKTTFLSILVLALEPSAGRRVYDGLDAARARSRPAIRRSIGYLPQDYRPLAGLTGREYLLHCARLRGVPLGRRALEERVRELLRAVGLSEAADRRAIEYSGGMQRRLGVAQAIIHSPRLLVVDEPTAGLDPEERIRFRTLIGEVAEQTAVLLSTHIVEDVEATCPRLVVIGKGRLLFDGTPTELLRGASGRLFRFPAEEPLPPGAVEVTYRADREGAVERVVWSETPIPGAPPRPAGLEEAYGAFLALRGVADVASQNAETA